MASRPAAAFIERKQGALLGLFVGDALAMPVHWYYNLEQLKKDHGTITGYVKPHDHMAGSYMFLSNADQEEIIGSVINHGKKKFWGKGLDFHYHVGLQAGENTLEGQLSRLLLRNLAESATSGEEVQPQSFLADYVKFMTTPGSHNDAFASTCHRMFFVNYAKGIAPQDCADNDNHIVSAIDALTLAIPAIVATVTEEGPSDKVRSAAQSIVKLTRNSDVLPKYVDVYADLLASVLAGRQSLLDAVAEAGQRVGFDVRQSVQDARQKAGSVDPEDYLGGDGTDPVVACGIDSSFPALLHFAYRYAEAGPRIALLASANAGGENVARGSALGALLGAQYGVRGFPNDLRALYNQKEIEAEITALTGPLQG